MRLTELQPTFMKRIDDKLSQHVDSLAEANGVMFLCPVCWKKNGGPVGTHAVLCWDPSVPQTTSPINGRWNLVGTGYQDLSLMAGSSSILIRNSDGSEHWHGFVKDGEVTHC